MEPISNHFKIGDIVRATNNDDVDRRLRGMLFKIIASPGRGLTGHFQYKLDPIDPKLKKRIIGSAYANDAHLLTPNDIEWWMNNNA